MEQQLPLFARELAPADQQTIREALTLLACQLREPGVAFTSSSSVRDWLRLQLASLEREEFTALFLDNQHRLIAHETLFTGTINHTQVHGEDRSEIQLRRCHCRPLPPVRACRTQQGRSSDHHAYSAGAGPGGYPSAGSPGGRRHGNSFVF